jgi:hypothetical protein
MPANLQKRRDFLKTAAAGAMGISAIKLDKVFASPSSSWTTGKQINPDIDNKRVICCYDTKMLTSTPTSGTMTVQNNAVDANRVASNLDDMAMKLAQKTTAAEAWSTIFRSAKPWASTKVAIKVNAIIASNGNHPRVAIIKKICDVLVDQLGVQPANIVLYDANSDASACYTTSFVSLTDKTKIRATVSKFAQSLGGMKAVTIAASTKTMSGVADLVDGNIDILVDTAVCKIHTGPGANGYLYGSCSLCMKNHLGTFINANSETSSGGPSSTGLHSVEAICEINRHDAIIGGNPVRQQLCIVDSLLANANNAGSTFDTRVDRIVMGTFAPIVDYLTAIKILKDILNRPDRNNKLPIFLTSFGYTEADVQDSWIQYTPGSGVVDTPSREFSGTIVTLSLSHPSYKRATIHFTIPHYAGGAMRASIIDAGGRLARTLSAPSDETRIIWDGRNNNGTTVSMGNYLVKIIAGTLVRTGSIVVSK